MILFMLALFQLKHLICDFILQGPYQYRNKGTYGHPGGLLHVTIHCVGTFLAMCIYVLVRYKSSLGMFTPSVVPEIFVWTHWVIVIEAVIHYHMDWAKVQIGNYFNWKPTNSEYYWWFLGFDQFVHQITYILMVFLLGESPI